MSNIQIFGPRAGKMVPGLRSAMPSGCTTHRWKTHLLLVPFLPYSEVHWSRAVSRPRETPIALPISQWLLINLPGMCHSPLSPPAPSPPKQWWTVKEWRFRGKVLHQSLFRLLLSTAEKVNCGGVRCAASQICPGRAWENNDVQLLTNHRNGGGSTARITG